MTHGVQAAVQAAIARSPPLPASAAELARPALLAALGHAWLAQLAGPLLSALANALLASFLVGGPLLFLVQQAVYASYAAGLVTHNQVRRPRQVVRGLGRAFLYLSIYLSRRRACSTPWGCATGARRGRRYRRSPRCC